MMSPVAAAYFLGTIGTAVALFILRRWCTSPRVRVALLLLPLLLLFHLTYLIVCPVCPALFSFLIPYTPDGEWTTTDVDGNPCRVTIQSKALCSSTPPGDYPRIRLESSSMHGTAVYVMNTRWRFGPGTITLIPGGMEIFMTVPEGWGAKLLLHRDRWTEETIRPKDWP